MTEIVVVCNTATRRPAASHLAGLMGAELLFDLAVNELQDGPEFALVFDVNGLSLQQTGRKAPGPVRAEFAAGAVNHRRKFGGGKGQAIAKAVGITAKVRPHVLDATAGLGRDAFVLATLGARVQMHERNPAVHALLEDGLARAAIEADPELADILARLTLTFGDTLTLLQQSVASYDVVYLDPMFPERQKSAAVKKEMKAFHSLVGADEDADHLLQGALAAARYRVVVKRPRNAPDLAQQAPSYRLEGKSGRFDIYARQKFPEALN
ncbi:class I SAM-dependent methyltransferase [Gilvimarinus chinensis]|uniref:class I SAM-dependent methyltransferase n=1 Tax=Gilvimarinus chinensis TaxID=396005 RepID=UPI00036B46F8|nr:class I SAM-dependent methyltransferase [Gilvimarinus chinensis]